ncbi:unnamed protein product [Phytophthora fragariaefolia]|uniref:Unnamed protein product n=1 Tax=Phytophthora fragariaefolia TaxID=1490495 RepID=A0A9W6WU66_9STRA|nr:unnamed protein product [Phytophthora fragariaefolia]
MATSEVQVSRLLVLGPDRDSKRALVSQLRELSGHEPQAAEAAVLSLRTKYYRASVELHVHEVRDNAPEPALQHELHEYEALLCVVDAGQRDSFLHVHRFAKRVVDVVPYDVCVLAAATTSATGESVKKIEGWCQDNGFEFVDLDARQREHGEDSVIDEKHGVERVLEALQCNMWRSMEMNPPKQEATAAAKVEQAAPEVDAAKEKSAELKSDNQVEDKDDASKAADTAGEAAEEQDASTDDSRLQALLQALEIAGGPDAASGDAHQGGDEDDLDMAEFSALISEVRNVRDQGQSLTDEQRRDRAAEVAMKLWNFLGADDEDSGASDSD